MQVAEAEKNFGKLIELVCSNGVSVDLERDGKIIARLTPAIPQSFLAVSDVNSFLRGLPSLGDDAADFAEEIREIRAAYPAESTPWE